MVSEHIQALYFHVVSNSKQSLMVWFWSTCWQTYETVLGSSQEQPKQPGSSQQVACSCHEHQAEMQPNKQERSPAANKGCSDYGVSMKFMPSMFLKPEENETPPGSERPYYGAQAAW